MVAVILTSTSSPPSLYVIVFTFYFCLKRKPYCINILYSTIDHLISIDLQRHFVIICFNRTMNHTFLTTILSYNSLPCKTSRTKMSKWISVMFKLWLRIKRISWWAGKHCDTWFGSMFKVIWNNFRYNENFARKCLACLNSNMMNKLGLINELDYKISNPQKNTHYECKYIQHNIWPMYVK